MTLEFAEQNVVPDDAWVAENQAFLTAGRGSFVVRPEDRKGEVE